MNVIKFRMNKAEFKDYIWKKFQAEEDFIDFS